MNKKTQRVVLLLQDLKFGGTQRQALELARRLDSTKYCVELWSLMAGEDFMDLAREYGLTVVCLGSGSCVRPSALWQLWRRLHIHTPDILLLLTGIPNIWGRIFGHLRNVPVIIGSCRQHQNPRQQHEWLLKRLAHHYICNAHCLKTLLMTDYAIPEASISVIHNGVDMSLFVPPEQVRSDQGKCILCLARLVKNKDHDTLLAAFELVKQSEPTARLIIAGDGPRRPALAQSIRERFPDGSVDLRPGTSDTLSLYHECTVFALSSVREGLPNVILEAMACGLPVAATAVDGVPELLEHEVTGLLSPAGNPRALADSLLRLLASESERARLGCLARRRTEESFSYETMTRSFETVFDALLGQNTLRKR